MLTSLLPPAACANCRLCCNFLPESAWESPALEPACAARLRERGIELAARAEGGETIALHWDAENPREAALCPLLDARCGCTLPREQRPLECRLWPLRLMRGQRGELLVCCYENCPGMAAVAREQLLQRVEEMEPMLMQRAREFPESVRPMRGGYGVVKVLVE